MQAAARGAGAAVPAGSATCTGAGRTFHRLLAAVTGTKVASAGQSAPSRSASLVMPMPMQLSMMKI